MRRRRLFVFSLHRVLMWTGALLMLAGNSVGAEAQNVPGPRVITLGAQGSNLQVARFGPTSVADLFVQTGSPPSGSAMGTLLLNDGAANFTSTATTGIIYFGNTAYAVGDTRNNGKLDAVNFVAANQIHVHLGNGDGSFVGTVVSGQFRGYAPAQTSVWSTAMLGKTTGSGFADLIAVDSANGNVVVFGNDGQDGFNQALSVLPVGTGGVTLGMGDLNRDGKLDVAVLSEATHGVSLYYGHGDGTFAAAVAVTQPNGIYSMLLQDIDGDGVADLVVEDATGSLSYFKGLMGGGFAPVSVALPGGGDAASGRGGHLIAIADLNGDGLVDLVTATPLGLSVLLGHAGSGYTLGGIYDMGPGRTSFAAGDFNGDGHLDVAVDHPNGVEIVFGKADGSFASFAAATGGVTASPEPSVFGANFTLSATFSAAAAGGAMPTGTVTFSIDGAVVGTGTLVNGVATFAVVSPMYAVGNHAVQAGYGGDANYGAVTASGTHAVTGLRSAITLTVLTPTIFYGQVADGSSVVSAVDSAAGATLNGGVITFFIDGTSICQLVVTGQQQTCPASAGSGETVGQHVLTATYGGNQYYLPSSSAAGPFAVLPDVTTTTVTSSANPSTFGQMVTFTAVVTAPYATPVGPVVFRDGNTVLGTVALNGAGVATFSTAVLGLGTHVISAVYAATLNFNGSASGGVVQVVAPAPVATVTVVSSSLNPSVSGQAVTFSAVVVTTGAPGIPAGVLTFLDGTTPIDFETLDSNGRASFTTSGLAVGSHAITASYGGGSGFSPSGSAVLTQVVTVYVAPGFTLTVTPASFSVGVGNSVNLAVLVTEVGGFSQPVQLACAGLPAETTCSFSATSIAAGGGTARLTVSPQAPHNCNSNTPYFVAGGGGSFVWLCGVVFGVLVLRRRRLVRGLVLVVGLCLLPVVNGCGGNCTDFGVRPGDYTFSVTATPASGGGASQVMRMNAHI